MKYIIVSLIIGLSLVVFFSKKEKPDPIVPIDIHEIQANIKEKVCKFGYCHYIFEKDSKEISLKNQRKEIRSSTAFIYYAENSENICVLRISEEKINPRYLNKLYRERSRYSLQCYDKGNFLE